MDYENDEMRYRKKAKSKNPKKANHKHIWEPIILVWNNPHYKFDGEKGWVSGDSYYFGRRCKVCSKLKHDFSEEFLKEIGINTYYTMRFFGSKSDYFPQLPHIRIEDYFNLK